MFWKKLGKVIGVLLGGLAGILALQSDATAGILKTHCKKKCPPCHYNSDFFGYYPTHWRPWPALPPEAAKEQQQKVMPPIAAVQPNSPALIAIWKAASSR